MGRAVVHIKWYLSPRFLKKKHSKEGIYQKFGSKHVSKIMYARKHVSKPKQQSSIYSKQSFPCFLFKFIGKDRLSKETPHNKLQ